MSPQAKEKRLINGDGDINQLMPIKYGWAWEHYLNGCANHWLPLEISMSEDILQWEDPQAFTKNERLLLKRNFGFFSTAETLVANNVVLAIYKFITNAEVRQYLLRQAFEEAVHAHAFVYICDSLRLDSREIFNMYREIPSISKKDAMEIELTKDLLQPNFSTDTFENKQIFLENLIGYYLILEGIFLYGGFAMILSFRRRKKMNGVCQMYEFILRDETIHLNFGIDLINGIKEENPELWTEAFQERILQQIKKAVDLEILYTEECLPEGLLGLGTKAFADYIRFLADRRLNSIGLASFFLSPNKLLWMSEAMDLYKEKNFFETAITEYRSSSELKWNSDFPAES